MVVTNRLYDTGFPFRIIETSNYIKLMKDMFKEDLNKCLAGFTEKAYSQNCVKIDTKHMLDVMINLAKELQGDRQNSELPTLSNKPEMPQITEKFVTEESLEELESWYESYMDKHQDQVLGRPDSD